MAGIFDDMNDDLGGNSYAAAKAGEFDIKKATHVANGGTGDNMRECGGCHGTGRWQGRGRCFACKGAGKVTARQDGARKGKATAAKNLEIKRTTYISTNMALYTFLQGAQSWSGFGKSMFDAIDQYGGLTEKQEAAAYSMMEKAQARDAERADAKATAAANAPTVALDAIEALFAKATDNAIKRPIFRAGTLAISKAPATGRNAGALYVKRTEDDAYLGKLVGGKFFATNAATAEDEATLHAVAADPTDAAIKYARRTGNCGCCGKGLVNPVSILAGIGPICADKWGLNFRRELAATEYADMKAAEIKKIKE